MKKGPVIGAFAGLFVVLVCGVAFYDAIPGTLRSTDDGPRGTGVKSYAYPGGVLKLREEYSRGKLLRSEWYSPNGTLIQATDWKDGSGEWIQLRDDGSVKTRKTFVKDRVDGKVVYYAPNGSVRGEAEFKDGQRVSGYDPQADPEWKLPIRKQHDLKRDRVSSSSGTH
jgi:hypothetical protein